MDAATITAWLSGLGLVLKAIAVLVTALRTRRDTRRDGTPQRADV